MAARKARAAARRRTVAVGLAICAHAAMLALLLTGSGRLPFLPILQQPATQVWLAPPTVLQPPTARRRPPPEPQRRSAARASASAPAAPQPPASPLPAAPSNQPTAATPRSGGATLATALRRSVGCAQANAPWMTDADRAACRQRLAAGAAIAPHLEGMSPVKLAYFTAVAKARADWLSGRNAGHGLAIGCIQAVGPGVRTAPPPHALRLGPCMIEPPRGSLDLDVDILPDGETAKAPPDSFTTQGLAHRH